MPAADTGLTQTNVARRSRQRTPYHILFFSSAQKDIPLKFYAENRRLSMALWQDRFSL
jgi:hypothetical protein